MYMPGASRQEEEIIETFWRAQEDAIRKAMRLTPAQAQSSRRRAQVVEDIEEAEEAWPLPPSLCPYERFLKRMAQYAYLLGNIHMSKEELKKMRDEPELSLLSVYRHWLQYMGWDISNLFVPADVLQVSCLSTCLLYTSPSPRDS